MPITYRAEKGTPLTSHEVDNNFRNLDTRIKALENQPETAEGLGHVNITGDHITLTGTFGTDFGTFPLPKVSLTPRGPWVPDTLYQRFDLCTTNTTLYCCLKDHTSTQWNQDCSFWQEVFTLPQPPKASPQLYEKATLPKEEGMGTVAVLLENEGASLIFFNGKTWQYLMKGDAI